MQTKNCVLKCITVRRQLFNIFCSLTSYSIRCCNAIRRIELILSLSSFLMIKHIVGRKILWQLCKEKSLLLYFTIGLDMKFFGSSNPNWKTWMLNRTDAKFLFSTSKLLWVVYPWPRSNFWGWDVFRKAKRLFPIAQFSNNLYWFEIIN